MSKHYLEREYIDSPLNRMCCMAMPQLVWMDMEASSSSPLAAYISNRLGEYREKRHDPEVGDHQPAPISAWSRPELTRHHSLWASPNRGRLST
jgi:hypothetical protein